MINSILNDKIKKLIVYMRTITLKNVVIVFLCMLFCSVLSNFVYRITGTPEYEATTIIITKYIPDNGRFGFSELAASHSLSDTFSYAYISHDVLNYTIDKLDLDYNEEQLLKKIKVERKKQTILVYIIARDKSPEKAILLSKTFTEGMQKKLAGSFNLNKITIVEHSEAIYISKSKIYTISGAIAGFFFYCIYLYVNHLITNKIWTEELVNRLNVTYLGAAYVDQIKEGEK